MNLLKRINGVTEFESLSIDKMDNKYTKFKHNQYKSTGLYDLLSIVNKDDRLIMNRTLGRMLTIPKEVLSYKRKPNHHYIKGLLVESDRIKSDSRNTSNLTGSSKASLLRNQ